MAASLPQPCPDLLAAAARWRDARGIGYYGRDLTWRRVDRDSTALAAALLGRGIGGGARVMVHLPNSPQLVVTLLAVLKCGAQALPYDRVRQCNVAITLDRFHSQVREQAPDLPIVVSGLRDYLPPPLKLLYPLKQRVAGEPLARLIPPLDTRFLPFLRRAPRPDKLPGTGAIGDFTAAALSCGGEQLRQFLSVAVKPGRDGLLLGIPLWEAAGLHALAFAMLSGLTLHLVPQASDVQMRRALSRTGPALVVAGSDALAALAATPRVLSGVRIAVAVDLPWPAVGEAVDHARVRLLTSLCTPRCGFVALAPLGVVPPPRSYGVPLPDVDVRLQDGRLQVQGPQTATPGEWIDTGREVCLEADGWLR